MESAEEKEATEMFSWEEMAKLMGDIENVSPWTETDWEKNYKKIVCLNNGVTSDLEHRRSVE